MSASVTQGFLLHSRPLRENEVLLSFFFDNVGRVDAVSRVSKSFKPKSSRQKKQRMPLPFCCYEAQWGGSAELKKLLFCEPVSAPMALRAQALYCGFYINELLYRLLPRHDVNPSFFLLYKDTLTGLQVAQDVEPLLRNLELALLDVMGYGLCFDVDAHGTALNLVCDYAYVPERGLVALDTAKPSPFITGLGADFLALNRRDFVEAAPKLLAKKLMRRVLAMYLGGRPLRSREFFMAGG